MQTRRRKLTLVAGLLLSPLGHLPEAAAAENGEKVYRQFCQECHGKTGRGDGEKAKRLKFFPRDLSLASFKCRSTGSGSLPTDADLMRVVMEGLPGSQMLKFDGKLNADQARSVVEYIKTFSDRFETESPGSRVEVPPAVTPSEQSVREGRQIYRILNCWSCHGVDGQGNGPASGELVDDWQRPVQVHNFVLFKKFKCGNDDADLYRTLHTGMNGSPMPSYRDAMLFGGDALSDFSGLSEVFGSAEAGDIEKYLDEQPTSSAISRLDESEKESLIATRTWALVHYLRSLLARQE